MEKNKEKKCVLLLSLVSFFVFSKFIFCASPLKVCFSVIFSCSFYVVRAFSSQIKAFPFC